MTHAAGFGPFVRESAMRLLSNIHRLFAGLRHAGRQPEVQGAASLALALIAVATVFYWLVEGWSLLDAAYFSVVTIATVGYGDFAPVTALGKIFTMGFIFSGIGIFVAAVSAVAQAVLRAQEPPPP
jgi:voltage-gated potassium channel